MPEDVRALSDSQRNLDFPEAESVAEEPVVVINEKTASALPCEKDGEDFSASQVDDDTVYVKGHPVIQTGTCCMHPFYPYL